MSGFLNCDPNVAWTDHIPLISTDDPVLGGPNGPVNVPHQKLADRTEHLKTRADVLRNEVDQIIIDLETVITQVNDIDLGAIRQDIADLRDISLFAFASHCS